jgi:ketosteroid isomerase-like protein
MSMFSTTSRRWTALAVIALTLLLTPGAFAALFRDEHHTWRNELFQMEDNWRSALLRSNVSAMSGLLADDYMAITANGMLESREQTLAHMRSGEMHFRSLVINDRKVRFYGDTAVVTSRAEVSGSTHEGDISGSYRYTHVWVREGRGPWKIVSFEASRIRGHEHK